MNAGRRRLLAAVAAALLVFLYAPLAVVAVASFNAARFGAGWEGFTLEWYAGLSANAPALAAAKNTLLLASVSTAVATVLGTLLGYGLARAPFRGRRAAAGLLQAPLLLPDIVLAVALLLFFSLTRRWLGVGDLGLGTMLVGHVTFQIPFVALVVRARTAGLDPALEEAARDLGAGPVRAFLRITLPLLAPGVLAGALLAFTLSLDDFVVSFFTSGPGATTLPVLIYSSARRGVTPDIHALSTLVLAASVLAVLAVRLLQGRRSAG